MLVSTNLKDWLTMPSCFVLLTTNNELKLICHEERKAVTTEMYTKRKWAGERGKHRSGKMGFSRNLSWERFCRIMKI